MSKADILAEIRRTTAANDGKPLGRERFAAETGIRPHMWSKYWARWGDAVKEAGFSPNEYARALSDEQMLEPVAALVRELGRFPVVGELRTRAHSDPTFPNEKTILGRRGGKRSLAERLHAFAMAKGYQDVAAICEPVLGAPHESENPPTRVTSAGEVYLLRSGRFYKIGRTNSIGRREYELSIQLPEKAQLVHSIETDDPAGIELYWHNRFKDRRKNGEWFQLTGEDVAAFRRRRTFM